MTSEPKFSRALTMVLLVALALDYPAHAANTNGNGVQAQGASGFGNQKSPSASGPRTSPGGVGGSGSSYGSGAISNERAGYLGGRATSTDPVDDSTGGTSTSSMVGAGTSGTIDNCRNLVPASMHGRNLVRFRQVGALLEHGAQLPQNKDADYLLANYQEELAKPAPDLSLAGIYLGLIATEPVTASAIENISHTLCVPVSHEQAVDIAKAAENQRLFVGRAR